MPITSSVLVFFVNGKKVIDENINPEWTLLYYLRTKLRLCGTKLGCGEGGCGSCTVMLSRYDSTTKEVRHLPINACLAPICSVHGSAVTTVEGIGSVRTKLHPVQERIAKAHGSQCGFCTPGIVMSMYTLLRNTPKPSMKEMEVAFQGNLCRCTGYRPIIEGYKTFTEEWELIQTSNKINGTQQNGNGCAMGDKCCKLQNGTKTDDPDEVLFKPNEFTAYDPTQEPIFPPELKLSDKYDNQFLTIKGKEVTWYRPVTLDQLLDLKQQFPDAKIVGGNTEIGLETKFKNMIYSTLIQPIKIPELVAITSNNKGVKVGSAVTFDDLDSYAKTQIKVFPQEKTKIFRALREILDMFAGKQIRSVGTLGGNIMTGSPISDFVPILMAINAELEVVSKSRGSRTIHLDHNFFTGYRQNIVQPDEILLAIHIPYTLENQYFYAYKQAKRRDDDIAIVNLAANVTFKPKTYIIEDIRLAFGGMSFKTVMAAKTQQKLIGLPWTRDTLELAFSSLIEDLPLDPSAPGGMINYRKSLTLSLFFRAFLAISKDLQEYVPEIVIDNRELSGINSFTPKEYKSSQYFSVVNGEKVDGLQQPVVQVNAYKQATGEALYCDDIPVFENELQLAFVVSSKAHAKILKVDPTEALQIEGVEGFFSAKDIDPKINFCGLQRTEKIFYDDIVTSEGQVIGVIVANDRHTARKAARKVKVEYQDLEPVIITIPDAIKHNSYFASPHRILKSGDLDKALKEAQHVLEGQAEIGGQEHFYFETQSIAVVPKEHQELEVHSSIQTPRELSMALSEYLGIPQHKIITKVRRIGGGFGGKETKTIIYSLPIVTAAVKLNRPIRCMLDRDEDIIMTGGRHPFLVKYKVGFNDDGKILGLEAHLYANGGHSEGFTLLVLEHAMTHIQNSYNIPSINVYSHGCKTHTRSNTAFRGFGGPQGMFACETILHHIASYLNKNPVDLSFLNLSKEGDVTHYNQKLINYHMDDCWKECLEMSQYDKRKQEVDKFNKENKYKKRGIIVVPTTYGIAFPFDFLNQGGALILVYTDGSVLLTHGGVEMGQGLHTKMIQVASKCLNIPMEKIYTSEVATDKVPNTTTTAASCSSDLNGGAVMEACNTIMNRLRPYRETNPNGTWEDWVMKAYMDRVNLSATGFYKTPDVGYNWDTNTGNLHSYYTYGVACCETEIDTLTGDHQVLRVDISMDLGQSLNPAIDIGQIEGAFMQGYGLTTLEEMIYSTQGVNFTRGPSTYKIPSFGNIPGEFNVSLIKGTSNPRAVFSSKAVGEPPLFLGASVMFSIREAIKAARKENGASPIFNLDAPVTSAKIRMACQDKISKMFKEPKPGSYIPWNAYETPSQIL